MRRLFTRVATAAFCAMWAIGVLAQSLTCGRVEIVYGNGVFNDNPTLPMETLSTKLAARMNAAEFAFLDFDFAENPSQQWWQDLVQAMAQQGISDATRILRWILGTEAVPAALQSIFESQYSSALGANLSSIVDEPTRLKHVSKYKGYISSEGKKVVVVAHSQGNYYANQAFPDLSPSERQSLGIVAVASPDTYVAQQVGGVEHVTLFADLIIAPIQTARAALFLPALLPNTLGLRLPASTNALGHAFVESYLESGSFSETKIANNVRNTIQGLANPPCPGANQPPIASFTAAPSTVGIGQVVHLDATASTDPDGTIRTYSWKFGDGRILSPGPPVYDTSYGAPGIYTITLAVTDNGGTANTTTRAITVLETDPGVALFNSIDVSGAGCSQLLQQGNNIIVFGRTGNGQGGFAPNFEHVIARFDSNGRLDPTFGVGGIARFNNATPGLAGFNGGFLELNCRSGNPLCTLETTLRRIA